MAISFRFRKSPVRPYDPEGEGVKVAGAAIQKEAAPTNFDQLYGDHRPDKEPVSDGFQLRVDFLITAILNSRSSLLRESRLPSLSSIPWESRGKPLAQTPEDAI